MSQGNLNVPVVGVVTGLTMAQDINNALNALTTQNSGASAPTNAAGGVPTLGQFWLNTTSATAPVLEFYDGAQWTIVGTIDVTNHIWTPPIAGGIATTLASATTTDLGSKPQAFLTVSGVTTITSLGTSAAVGTVKIVTFSGILTLTYNAASLILPTAANITTAAGDVAAFVMMTSGNWRCLFYTLASGAPLSTAAVGAAQLIASSQGMNAPLNLRINATVSGGALTVALKTAANADATSGSPILIPFRDATIANGDPVILSLQAALSFATPTSGNTFGTLSSNVAFRLWVIAYYNGGTLAVGLFNASTATQIFPLSEQNVVTTAASTNGGSSAGVFYANVSTITNTPFRILGYLEWGSGLGTAGTWASAPTTIKLFGPGDKKPGDIVQTQYMTTLTDTQSNSTTVFRNTALAMVFTPTSAPNPLRIRATGSLSQNQGAAGISQLALMRGATQVGPIIFIGNNSNVTGTDTMPATVEHFEIPNLITASTYAAAVRGPSVAASANYPSTLGGSMCIDEFMG